MNLKETNQKIEDTVTGSYKKIEDKVTGSYKKIEDTVVFKYNEIESKFVGKFLTKDNETIEEAKARIKKELKSR